MLPWKDWFTSIRLLPRNTLLSKIKQTISCLHIQEMSLLDSNRYQADRFRAEISLHIWIRMAINVHRLCADNFEK